MYIQKNQEFDSPELISNILLHLRMENYTVVLRTTLYGPGHKVHMLHKDQMKLLFSFKFTSSQHLPD